MADSRELAYPIFLRRMREMAHSALDEYGKSDARLTFVNYSGNGLYRVDVPGIEKTDGPFVPGRYALRLHRPSYMSPENIRFEPPVCNDTLLLVLWFSFYSGA